MQRNYSADEIQDIQDLCKELKALKRKEARNFEYHIEYARDDEGNVKRGAIGDAAKMVHDINNHPELFIDVTDKVRDGSYFE